MIQLPIAEECSWGTIKKYQDEGTYIEHFTYSGQYDEFQTEIHKIFRTYDYMRDGDETELVIEELCFMCNSNVFEIVSHRHSAGVIIDF